MVQIEVDGVQLEVPKGAMIIEATDKAGIEIPRFCYHHKLSVAANCRMCLVEVEKAPKPLPACATPVADGMKIFTKSPKARFAQKAVMEFLLINHPLDCPVCDQGGQCELQDVAMSYGENVSQYTEGKRVVKDKDIGPLISTEMTRCIHCTRCVRFGSEIAGIRELGATGRGEFTEIGTFIENSVDSEVSGNVIDLCPVGALTSKPFRFRARAWEVQSAPSVAPHDCLGSNIYYHTQRSQVLRTVPRENERVNEVWLSDRDRFSYESLYHPDRLDAPWIKQDGQWQKTDWETALRFATQKLEEVNTKHGAKNLGVLMSPNCTLEEYYLAQKIFRAKGCNNLDHRLRQTDFSHAEQEGIFPELGITPEALEKQEAILLIGSNLRKENPLLNLRVGKACKNLAKVMSISPTSSQYSYDLSVDAVGDNGDIQALVAGVLKAVIDKNSGIEIPQSVTDLLSAITPNQEAKDIAENLLSTQHKCIILGHLAVMHPHAHVIFALVAWIGKITKAAYGQLSIGSNSAGAYVAGCIPHRGAFGKKLPEGLNALEQCQHPRKGYLIMGCELENDSAFPRLAHEAMHQAECVVALASYDNPNLREYADCILPIAPFAETQGTTINCLGDWQSFMPATKPFKNSKPGWKVLRVLGELWDVSDISFDTQSEILTEIKSGYEDAHHFQDSYTDVKLPHAIHDIKGHNQLVRIAPVPLYSTDSMTRRADALQKTADAVTANMIWLHPESATNQEVTDGQVVHVIQDGKASEIPMTVKLSTHIPVGAVEIAQGIRETMVLGAPYGLVELTSHNKDGISA